jgi:hypothetical protein
LTGQTDTSRKGLSEIEPESKIRLIFFLQLGLRFPQRSRLSRRKTVKSQQLTAQSSQRQIAWPSGKSQKVSFVYFVSAILVLTAHAGFIVWVIFGAAVTRARPVLTALHVLSLVWALVIEILPWTCPLTLAENWLEQRAGITSYQGGFVLHYLDALIYPNLSPSLLTAAAALVFAINVIIYGRRLHPGKR